MNKIIEKEIINTYNYYNYVLERDFFKIYSRFQTMREKLNEKM